MRRLQRTDAQDHGQRLPEQESRLYWHELAQLTQPLPVHYPRVPEERQEGLDQGQQIVLCGFGGVGESGQDRSAGSAARVGQKHQQVIE